MKKVLVICFCFALSQFGVSELAYYELLATPSTTSAFDVADNVDHAFQYITTGVSTNVIVQSEGSIDGSNWFMLADNETPTTITSNTTKYEFKSSAPFNRARVRWLSKSGTGTTPNIGVYYRGNRR